MSAPQVHIHHHHYSLSAVPVRQQRRNGDRRSLSSALMILNVSAWAYALMATGSVLT